MPLNPECLTDLNRIRKIQSPAVDYPSGDEAMFELLINSATSMALNYTNRLSFKYQSITDEYHDGNGSDILLLNYWPILLVASIYDDSGRAFASSSLLDYNQDPQNDDIEVIGPRNHKIRMFDGVFGCGKSNIKVTYTAGYSDLIIQGGVNDQIAFTDSGGDVTSTLTEGKYNAVSLATELQTQMTTDSSDTITVSYSTVSHRYKISTDGGTLSLNWLSTTNDRAKSFGELIGFNVGLDSQSSTSYYSSYPILGIPEDIIDTVTSIVIWRYNEHKEVRTGKISQSKDVGDSSSFDYSNIPARILETLDPYIIWHV